MQGSSQKPRPLATTGPGGPSPVSAAGRVARNAAIRSVGEIIAKVASVAFYVAMARSLGADGFGDFVFAFSLTTVFLLASGFGTEELIARELARSPAQVHRYLPNVIALKAVTSAALLLAAVGVAVLAGYPTDTCVAVAIIGFGVAIDNFGRTWYAVFQGYERMELVSVTLVLQRFATAGVGIAVLATGGGLLAVSVTFTAGAAFGLLAAEIALRRYVLRVRHRVDWREWLPIVRAALPIGLAGALFVALLKVDVVLLGLIKGGADNTEVGIYGAAFRLVEATMFLSWSFGTAMLPWLARHRGGSGSSLSRGYERGLKIMTATLLPIGLVFVLMPSELIQLVYGELYDGAVIPLQLLGVMTVLYGVNDLAVTVLIARNRPADFTRVVALVAAENIAMNLVLIPAYGARGAAFNAAVSAALLAVLSLRRVTGVLGRIHLARAFAGPLAGGVAMATAILLLEPPLAAGLAAGFAAYLAVLAVVERLAFPDDLAAFLRLLRERSWAVDEAAPAGAPGRLKLEA